MNPSAVQAVHPTKPPFDPEDVVTTERLDSFMDEGRPMLNNYTRHAKIGEGKNGEVYLCYQVNTRYPQGHRDRRVPVAMKSVKRNNPRAMQFKQLRQQRLPTSAHTPLVDRLGTTEAKIRKEIAIMKKCRHPHVVRLYEIIDDRTRDKIYMVMEYLAGGEVRWKDNDDKPVLSMDQTRRIIRDAVLGLEYLHHQGIIHRDIKPANLLWTEDRRQVKIADFGVSHFSYAQRLAAAGKAGAENTESILLDDSDLTRRTGTPAFLAPEVVYEHTNESPGSSSSADVPAVGTSSLTRGASTQSIPNLQRPPITKSIDIWALGVTLYCLLFGKTPFMSDPVGTGSEWALYNLICNQDWAVDETMSADHIPTGGRHPSPGDMTEGAVTIRFLDSLLKKDINARFTLEEVKRSEWVIWDLPELEQWMQRTTPQSKINVTVSEASDAIATVHFRWHWGNWGGVVTKRISSLFRRTRDHALDDRDSARGPVRSEPHMMVRRHQSARLDSEAPTSMAKKDKGKQRAPRGLTETKGRSSKSLRSKSKDPWPTSAGGSASMSTSAIVEPKRRRGSTTLFTGAKKYNTVSSSPTGSEKPRARFANIFSIAHWRPTKYASPSPGTSPVDMTAGPSSSVADVVRRTTTPAVSGRTARRSDEVLRYYRTGPGTPLTADRRASSWGQGDQPSEFAEVVSMTSSYDFFGENEPQATGSGIGPYGGDRDRTFTPRNLSRLSTNIATATTSPTSGPPSSPLGDDEQGTFGPPCFDEDSSTIASVDGEWQNGHNVDDGQGETEFGGPVFEDDDQEESEEEDSDDQDENVVTFSPRKRTNPADE